jgi:hypothetical protein
VTSKRRSGCGWDAWGRDGSCQTEMENVIGVGVWVLNIFRQYRCRLRLLVFWLFAMLLNACNGSLTVSHRDKVNKMPFDLKNNKKIHEPEPMEGSKEKWSASACRRVESRRARAHRLAGRPSRVSQRAEPAGWSRGPQCGPALCARVLEFSFYV